MIQLSLGGVAQPRAGTRCNPRTLTTVDYFAGFGGFSEAALLAGERAAQAIDGTSAVSVDVAINHHQVALDVHRLNHDAEVWREDLITFDHRIFKPGYESSVQLLLAAPACQAHSQCARPARKRSKSVREYHDLLRLTAESVARAARDMRPTAMVIENVPQFAKWNGFEGWLRSIESSGYRCRVHQLLATDFGVPQLRNRLFISAVSSGRDVVVVPTTPGARLPASTCIEWNREDPSLIGRAGMWKPLEETKSAAALAKRRKALEDYPRGVLVYAYSHNSVHCAWTEPWRTITTKTPSQVVIVRWDGMYRRPLPSEIAAAMGFRSDFVIPRGLPLKEIDRGFGGAVCPPVGASVIEAVVLVSPSLELAMAA
jgi:DNA (cytosine-5)-methyltransferase 1